MKNPSNVSFVQPEHGQGKTSTAKNKSKLSFKQPDKGTGKTSSKKNPTNVPFKQKTASMTPSSTKKNKENVGFEQPNRAGKTAKMPQATPAAMSKGDKIKKAKPVAPPAFKSTADLVKYRKKKYGV